MTSFKICQYNPPYPHHAPAVGQVARKEGGGEQKNEKTQHFWHILYLVKVKENPDVILLKVCDNLIQLDNIVHIILPLRYNYESIPLGDTRHAF